MFVNNEQEWEASGIFQRKGAGGKRKYLVAYSECNESKGCWLAKSELLNALDILSN